MHQVQKAATLSLVATSIVVVVKLVAGQVTGSISVFGEGLQSFVDVLIAFGVVQTVKLAARPPDETHPYGHGKAEVIMSGLQMLLITGTSGFVISQAVLRIRQPQEITVDWGVAAMAFSATVNLLVATQLEKVAKANNSAALRGEVLHLRSDTFAAVGLIVGLVAVHFTKWTVLDPLLAIGFTLVVVVAAMSQLRGIVHLLMDGAAPPEEIAHIEKTLLSHPKVKGFHALRTRTVGSTHHVDLHVLLDDNLTFVEAHEAAESVESEISQVLGGARVNVHYEPYYAELRHQQEKHPEGP